MLNKTFKLDELHKLVNGHVVCVTCKYDPDSPAVTLCEDCGEPLCKICGYGKDDHHYCNECWEDRNGKCSRCGSELEPIYENNGADEMGARHDDIFGYRPCECRKEIYAK